VNAEALIEAPPLPYLGLRRFEAADRDLYRGRDADLELCMGRLASPAVRVLVLQGLSGSGKSSFLRAGLLPRLQARFAESGGEGGIVPICAVTTAGAGMVESIARQVYEFVIQGPGRELWRKESINLADRYPTVDAFVKRATTERDALIEFIAELSNNPKYAALIAIDQVEEFWTGPTGSTTDTLREQFLRMVYEFALERLNGKLVLSIRTEQYGIFASRLPDSEKPAFASLRGVNKLFHHYLADPSPTELIELVTAPTTHYDFVFEPGLPELLVEKLRDAATNPEMCVLPLLQTVLLRLYLQTRAAASGPMVLSTQSFQALQDAAEGKSTGFVDDFVGWGLAQAVGKVLKYEDGQRRRMEVSCWREVLRGMSSRTALGVRTRLRLSMADIEKLRLTAYCEVPAERMVKALTDASIGLLAKADERGRYALQHDLICLTFDQLAAISSPGFWLQADRDRRSRIKRAIQYQHRDLYDVDDAPPRHRIKMAELRFWDHKTLAYADEHGLFDRLGFDVERVLCNEDVTATELLGRLDCDADTHAVFSYPRISMKESEQQISRDIVMLNSFTGFAVICNASAARKLQPYQEDGEWTSFDKVIRALLELRTEGNCSFLAEDSLARDFFVHLLAIARLRFGDDIAAPLDAVAEATTCSTLSGFEFIDSLLKLQVPSIAIVTAPSWALAMVDERSLKPVIHQRALLGLLDGADSDSDPSLGALRRALEVRNVMNLRHAASVSAADIEAMELRLASIGLFLADCVWAQDTHVGDWIRKRWAATATGNHGAQISKAVFLGTFRRSCGFVAAEEYGRRYFGGRWADDCPSALKLHHKLQLARMDYEDGVAALAARENATGAASNAAASLLRRARNHADINNYHDARRLVRLMLQRSDAAAPAH
jgi:hypothetical protein